MQDSRMSWPVWDQLGKSNWDFAKNHHSSRMKCDLHTLDLGLQHSGCFWKLLLSLPILLFLASGCCSSVVDTVFHSSLEAEVTVSRVGSTLCVGSPSPSPPPSANLPTINRGWKKSLHDCLLLLLPGSCCCFVGVDGLDCDTVVLKWLKPAKNNFNFLWFHEFFSATFSHSFRFRSFIVCAWYLFNQNMSNCCRLW